MSQPLDYLDKNRQAWNTRTEHHIHSAFYDVEGFVKGKNSLNEIELKLLGDVRGKRILHLQCHFGQDSLSLARMGAIVTGVDFSETAISNARKLAASMNLDARFICADIYGLPLVLDEQFDIVFTSYGTINWLPDLDRWASVIAHFLGPHGLFVFAEFHPVVWMFDNDFGKIQYAYSKGAAITEVETGTYAEKNAPIEVEMTTWNHGIGEVLTALLSHNLGLSSFDEYDYSPYDCFRHTVEFEKGKFRIAHLGNKIPMVYALSACVK